MLAIAKVSLHVSLNCFVNFIPYPTDNYVLKVNNKKADSSACVQSKKKAWHGSGVFIVDFDNHINRVFLLLTLSKYLSVGCERQVITSWKHKKRSICFLINVDRPISFSNLSLHRIKDKLWHIIKRYYYIWTYYGHMFYV